MLHRIRALFRRPQIDRDLQEELRLHLDEIAQSLIDEGVPEDQARRQARLTLGGAAQIREVSGEAWRFGWIETWLRDLRFAVRALRRQPVFSLAAIATFALGIGAATAIFSVAYGIAFRPLPYPHADHVVRIYEANTTTHELKHQVSQGTFQGWREGAASIEFAALFSKGSTAYVPGDTPQPLTLMAVSPRFFDVLGITPAAGRSFKADAEYTRFTASELVLTDAVARRLFGSARDAIGKRLPIVDRSKPYEIVGVMPASFQFEGMDAWRPEIVELPVARILRSWRYDRAIARLKPDASITQLRGELDVVSARLAQEFPATNRGWTTTVEPMRDAIIGSFSRASWLLIAAVAAVLLVACANVAGLLAARAVGRTRETSIRVSLGAGAWRLAQMWIAETLVLAAVGATGGIALAWLTIKLLRLIAAADLPRANDIAIDLPVLLAAAGATIAAAIACALAPLVGARLRTSFDGLRSSADRAGDSRARRRVSTGLVALQCAGALALVVLSVAFARSFFNLTSIDLGWRPDGLLALNVAPRLEHPDRRPWAMYVDWSERLIARLNATPGVAGAAITTQIPFAPEVYRAEIAAGPDAVAGEARFPIGLNMVTPGYFDMMRMTLVRGRAFTADDRLSADQLVNRRDLPRGVAIVSQTVARTLWPDQDPIGKVFRVPSNDSTPSREVVGVVADVQFESIRESRELAVFLPWRQTPTGNPRLIVRAAGDAAAIAPLVRAAVLDELRATGIDRVVPIETLVSRATAQSRLTSQMVAALGALALVLSGVGIYGALATLVRGRARDTAVRMALGASPGSTWRDTLRAGLAPVVVGGAAGLATGAVAIVAVRSLLVDVSALSPAPYAIAAAATTVVAIVACAGPAFRASRTQASQVLRGD